MPDYDLVVIGTGPAGEKGAAQAAYFGKRVAIVERRPVLGGARIHACALPSKNLRETALALSGLRQRQAPAVSVSVDRGASLADLLCRQEPVLSAEIARVRRNLEAHGVTILGGHARFEDPHTLRVDPVDAGAGPPGRVTAGTFLVATGSTPLRPPGLPWDDPCLHDSDGILTVERLPESLIVIGAGVVGCELASMFAPLGVKITLLEGSDRLLPFADGEVSAMLADGLRRAGIDLRFRARAERVARAPDGGLVATLASGEGLRAERVLFCGGRVGNTADLGLGAAGLAADARGRLPVDASYRTAVPHIYAAGDVIGFPALASTSMEQARIAMCHAFDLKYKTRLGPNLPLGIYTIPELAMVGETEESARAKGLAVEVGRAFYRDNPRGQIAGDAGGVLKLVFRPDDRRLVGAHIVGERATELIHVASTCLDFAGAIDAFIDAVYNYPTLTELYKYAAYDGLGRLQRRGGS
jgi:NAD(P) transhydrogenase